MDIGFFRLDIIIDVLCRIVIVRGVLALIRDDLRTTHGNIEHYLSFNVTDFHQCTQKWGWWVV